MPEKYAALTRRLKTIHNLRAAEAVLNWDMNTMMPEGGAKERAAQLATLAEISHEMFIDEETSQLLIDAAAEVADQPYDSTEASMIRIVRDDMSIAVKQPTAFVAKFAQLTSEAHHKWAEARAKKDFSIYQPYLEQIVEMVRQKAEYLGYEDHPYDALLGEFERSMNTAQVKEVFDAHKSALVELVAATQAVSDRVSDAVLHQSYPVDKQREFGEMVAKAIGYSFERGRLDESVHPFSTSFARDDSRITTRYDANWLNPALFGTMHECGHSMYEQGIAEDLDGNMLGFGTSLGVHESQSRTWENMVGRSKNFWQWALPKLKDVFPSQLGDISVDDFYKAVNTVSPSFIRVEADEATYNLHIMVRFEIEQAIVTGEIAVKDIPDAWNTKFYEYLGITPEHDADGCLQDIHWSMGAIGYFPTYALGNLLGAQYFKKAVADMPSIPDDIANGRFETLLNWQKENIHQHGRKFNSDELTRRITGEGIQSNDYIAYLTQKYTEVYGL